MNYISDPLLPSADHDVLPTYPKAKVSLQWPQEQDQHWRTIAFLHGSLITADISHLVTHEPGHAVQEGE